MTRRIIQSSVWFQPILHTAKKLYYLRVKQAFFALSALAAPAATACRECSPAKFVVDVPANQTTLVAISKPVSFVGLGVGVQNYTCGSTGTYTSAGALAELVDISCLYKNTALFKKIPDIAIKAWSKAPASMTAAKLISTLADVKSSAIQGEHYFITNPVTGVGISPKWDFSSHAIHNSSAVVVGAKTGDMPAPTGSQDIDWLSLNAVPGQGLLADQVFRTDTRLGQPPASCTPGSAPISVKYVAIYWLLGGAFAPQ